jgi:5,5'-dehydrodivanillate O-demethylase
MSVQEAPPRGASTADTTPRQKLLNHEFPHTGPGTLAGRYMRQFWQPVSESKTLLAGRAKTIRIMGENFTLYRGQTGVAHVVAHRCAHRLTQLSVGYVEEDAIRCMYHGWKFAGDGRCIERPGEAGCDGGNVRIAAYPTREYLGLIFAYFGGGEEPPFPPFPAFEGDGLIETNSAEFMHNYFQGWENDWDIYHVAYTHRAGGNHIVDYAAVLESETYEETDYGIVRRLTAGPKVSVLLMPATVRLMIPTFNEQMRRGIGPTFRPTYIVHVPKDDETHHVFVTQMVDVHGAEREEYLKHYNDVQRMRAETPKAHEFGQEIFDGKLTMQDVIGHPLFVEIEDILTQTGQGAIVDRTQEHLGRTDAGIVLLRRLWSRELQSLADGRPTKAWSTQFTPPEGTDVWIV